MKKYLVLLILLIPGVVYAGRGCCSHNGGVCGCTSHGKQLCCNGKPSPTCTCTPPTVYGCTDYKANNFNRDANTDDGSCTYTVRGCTDPNANNYNSSVNENDGSCTYTVMGCTDYKATNYNSNANKDDGSCKYEEKTEEAFSYDNNYTNNNSEETDTGSAFLGFLTVASSVAAIVYAKKKKK